VLQAGAQGELKAGMSSKAADMTSNVVDLSSKDSMMLKAGELKAGILALGGSPAGLIEKSELVALYRHLLEQAKGSISSE